MTMADESEVRAALEAASDLPRLAFDPGTVLEQGHRAVRRRRLRHAGVAAAAVVAVAVGVLGSQVGPDHAIPAAPSPGPATTLKVDFQDGTGSVRKTDMNVEVTYDVARRTGTFAVSRANGSRTRAEVTLDRALGAGFTVTDAGTDHAVLYMLIPNTMNVRPVPMTRLFEGQWSASDIVQGTELVAVVRSLSPDDPGPRTLYRAEPEQGALFVDGSSVDTARVTLGEATVFVWLNPLHRVWGYTESVDERPASGGGGNFDAPIDSAFFQLEGTAGTRDPAGNPVWTTLATGLLPAGATQVKPTFRTTQPVGIAFGSAVMSGDGRVALAMRCSATAAEESSSEELCRELKGVSWVDRAGAKHFTALR